MRRAISILIAILLLAPAYHGTQATPEKAAAALPKLTRPLPFKAGEILQYEVSFSKLIFSGAVGDLKLSVVKADSAQKDGKDGLVELKAEVKSKGFFPKLFGLKVNDRYDSVVSANDFGLHSATRTLEQGDSRLEQKSQIDREQGRVTYVERNLKDVKAEPSTREASSPAWVQDILSACYYIRTRKLNEGEIIPLAISDAGQTYNIEVIAGKREEVKTDAGKFKTVMLDAKVFDGKFIRRSGEMFIWVADDQSRIPVRAKIKSAGVTIHIELKSIRNS